MIGIESVDADRQRPGQVEKIEFEYERHGTQCLIGNFEVATGQAIAPTVQATRNENDFAAHIEQTMATDPESGGDDQVAVQAT